MAGLVKTNDGMLSAGTIATAEVHIWHASLEQPENAVRWLSSLLSQQEVERAERFHFEQHRLFFITARGILRHLLSLYSRIEPERVQIQYIHNGKPVLAGEGASDLRFNLTHSGNLVMYAFTRGREVGIDVEQLKPIEELDQIAERNFSSSERTVLKRLPHPDRLKAFYLCWTRKEAFIKAIGEGISFPLQEFDVSLRPGEPARLLSVFGSQKEASRWSMSDIRVPEEYAAALVVEGQQPLLVKREWHFLEEFSDKKDSK
jgi:4'-phosphopantetheinyl transferase